MTVIAGYTNGEDYAIAADSIVTEGDYWYLDGPKVWRRGPFLIGAAGSYRECVTASQCPSGEPEALCEFMEENVKKKSDFVLLVVARGNIWVIDRDFIPVVHDHWWAIGTGAPAALGALYYSYRFESLEPEYVVHRAVDAAIALHVSVRGPVVVLSNET